MQCGQTPAWRVYGKSAETVHSPERSAGRGFFAGMELLFAAEVADGSLGTDTAEDSGQIRDCAYL